VKESKFFSVLFVAIAFLLALTVNYSYAQEEAAPADTVIQEEVVPVEEEVVPVEEEAVEEQAPAEETVKEEPSMFKPGWSVKAYINGGVIEPWGDRVQALCLTRYAYSGRCSIKSGQMV
jgi:hypothetical protein